MGQGLGQGAGDLAGKAEAPHLPDADHAAVFGIIFTIIFILIPRLEGAGATLVQEAVHPDALTIFGATFDENLDDEIRVTVIATGFAEPDEVAQISEPVAAKTAEAKQPAQEPTEGITPEEEAELKEEQSHFDDILKIFERGQN